MTVNTIEPTDVFDVLGLTPEVATFQRPRPAAFTEKTNAVAFTQAGSEDLLWIWKGLIDHLVGELIRTAVRDHLRQYFQSTAESDLFRYSPESVTTTSAERVRRIRAQAFRSPETFVVYTEEELRNFF